MTWQAFDLQIAVLALEWFFVGYFLLVHGGHTLLAVASMNNLRRHIQSENFNMLPRLSVGYEVPVSIIVPVSGATEEVGRFVHSLFNLDYPEFEVIVVVDGANDDTLSRLRRIFEMEIFPEAFWHQVRSKAVRAVYRSVRYPKLRVIDKERSGTGDAINAGVNAARYPIVCVAHADCGLQRTSLRRLVQHFIEDPNTVAWGTAPRITSRSLISTGFEEQPILAGRLLSLVQVTANLRKDLCGLHGWAEMNACLVFSDRLCAFRKLAFVEAGGCNWDAVNPVLELLERIHRLHASSDKPCRIAYSPAPLVWRSVPAAPAEICRSIANEHRGLSDALISNSDLLWRKWTGPMGRLAFPFLTVTEIAGPSIEVLSILFFLSAFALDLISGQHLIAFAICSAGLGILVSWLAIMLDAFIFRTYAGASSYLLLLIGAFFENVGYRQLVALCTVPGLPPHTTTRTAARQ